MRRRSNWIGTASTLTTLDFTGNDCWTNPQYTPACVHFIPHIGYLGLVWNARWFEIADFVVGWGGLDPSGDDGYAVGKWSFPRRRKEGTPEEPVAPTEQTESPLPKGRSGAIQRDIDEAPGSRPPATAPRVQPQPPQPVERPATPQPGVGHRKYIVKNGDVGLMQIARDQLKDVHKWKKIAELNNIPPPYIIKIGQELLLPD